MEYLMKYEDSQQYGGPEEGGWWYNLAVPQWEYGIPLPFPQKLRSALCRFLNRRENEKPHKYGYTSVLSYREQFFSFGTEGKLIPAIPRRPHYE